MVRAGKFARVRFDHCLMRIILDDAVGGRWTETVRTPAYKHLTAEQLARAIAHAEAMLDGGPEVARTLNAESLAWRRAAGARRP